MINSVYVQGVNVESVTPNPRSADVDVNTDIRVEFNSDLDSSTIMDNILVLKDTKLIYDSSASIDLSQYTQLTCNISYKDRTVILTPKLALDVGSRYIVYVKGKVIKDVLGNVMPTEYLCYFYTEGIATNPKCELVSPAYGTVETDTAFNFKWKTQKSTAYLFQVSKFSTFEELMIDKLVYDYDLIVDELRYANSSEYKEGVYYWRVKSLNGNWSDTSQFFFKENNKAPVSHEDILSQDLAEIIIGQQNDLEVLEVFPKDGANGVYGNLNIIYIKLKGKVQPSDINPDLLSITYEPIEPTEDSVGSTEFYEYTENTVNYKSTVVYDEILDVSYIVFTLTPISTDTTTS